LKVSPSSHLVDPIWEGGILGTGGLAPREPGLSRSRPSRNRKRQATTTRRTDSPKKCPIEGCREVFQSGRLGWDAHVGSERTHPDWEPSLVSSEDRKRAFREQFSDWFEA
jgi:hypothetical protein